MTTKLTKADDPEVTRLDNEEEIRIGDWWWVKFDDDYDFDDRDWYQHLILNDEGECLLCVEHIGSNFVEVRSESDGGSYGWKVHLDEWYQSCRKEPNWRAYVEDRIQLDQAKIQETMKQISSRAESLHLTGRQALPPSEEEEQSLLPSTYVTSPDKYKADLIVARDEQFPQLEEDVKKYSTDLAVQTRNSYLPDKMRMKKLKEVVKGVEDKIFTVELYVGMNEDITQIKKGEPAPADTPITIRQLVLFMDEETLFEYKSGGMDITDLKRFDEWVVKKKNLSRILPEARGVVAMQVRRERKDYGESESIAAAISHIQLNEANMSTYLLIRNGDNVYRIATGLDFKPRLVPLKTELNEEYRKEERWWDHDLKDYKKESELITPDHLDYDEHVLKRLAKIKQYNRIILILQGLIDRTNIFQPMPRANLSDPNQISKWCNLVRDEEALPAPPLDWKEYQERMNSTLKKGKVVMVGATYRRKWHSTGNRGSGYWGECFWDESPAYGLFTSYTIYKVASVKRDRSAVEITFPERYSDNSYEDDGWRGQGRYRGGELSGRTSHLWVPMKYILNVSDYTLGDYMMFLCNHAAKGKYNKWARYVITAEEFARGNLKVEESKDETD